MFGKLLINHNKKLINYGRSLSYNYVGSNRFPNNENDDYRLFIMAFGLFYYIHYYKLR
jgi:hypothetical protein